MGCGAEWHTAVGACCSCCMPQPACQALCCPPQLNAAEHCPVVAPASHAVTGHCGAVWCVRCWQGLVQGKGLPLGHVLQLMCMCKSSRRRGAAMYGASMSGGAGHAHTHHHLFQRMCVCLRLCRPVAGEPAVAAGQPGCHQGHQDVHQLTRCTAASTGCLGIWGGGWGCACRAW